MFAFYNIGFQKTMLGLKKHEDRLKGDVKMMFEKQTADVVLLSECGEVERGLGTWVGKGEGG